MFVYFFAMGAAMFVYIFAMTAAILNYETLKIAQLQKSIFAYFQGNLGFMGICSRVGGG